MSDPFCFIAHRRCQDQHKQCQEPNTNPSYDSFHCCPSYTEFLDGNKLEAKNVCDHFNAILGCQAWMSKCETKLFCEAATKLSYQICIAKNLCEVREVTNNICNLFLASAVKENALAEVVKSYALLCKKGPCFKCDCKIPD